MMLPVFEELLNARIPDSGCILCVNNEHPEIEPTLYDVLGAWLDGSLIYRYW